MTRAGWRLAGLWIAYIGLAGCDLPRAHAPQPPEPNDPATSAGCCGRAPTPEELPVPHPSPDPLALPVAEPGTVAFLSSIPAGGAGNTDGGEPRVEYVFGEPLYADFELPLAIDSYAERYGFDEFTVRVVFMSSDGGSGVDGVVGETCSQTVKRAPGHGLSVSLFRDARIPADIDLTDCVVKQYARGGYRPLVDWSTALVELYASSRTTGIRERSVASGHIDLGIPLRKRTDARFGLDVRDLLESYALLDRRLQQQLLPGAHADRLHGGKARSGALARAFPASRMPSLDGPALAAVLSATSADVTRHPLRAAITSGDWEYAMDVKAKRPVDRFVVGVAAFRTANGACVLENAAWLQRLGASGPGEMTARVPRSAEAIPIDCGLLAKGSHA